MWLFSHLSASHARAGHDLQAIIMYIETLCAILRICVLYFVMMHTTIKLYLCDTVLFHP